MAISNDQGVDLPVRKMWTDPISPEEGDEPAGDEGGANIFRFDVLAAWIRINLDFGGKKWWDVDMYVVSVV